MKQGYSRRAGIINDPYDREVHEQLIKGNGLFFPDVSSEFRNTFRVRWRNQLLRAGWRLRVLKTTHQQQDGMLAWLEKA